MMNSRLLKVSLFALLMTVLSAHCAQANNLRISNVTMEDRGDSQVSGSTDLYVVVEFDIAWDNSWRNTTNYDGVWVFFKIENTVSGIFDDLNLDYDVADNTFTSRKIDPLLTSPGSNSSLQIEIPIDPGGVAEGFFIYRNSTGSGTVQSENVRMPVTIASSLATTSIKIHVFGIEMVNIPEGPFYAGDISSTATFADGSDWGDTWYIDSSGSINVGNAASGTFYYTTTGAVNEFSSGAVFTIPEQYPTGYDEFWMMKYELTEGQWVDFYNTLEATQQSSRDITDAAGKNSTSVVKRNTIDDNGTIQSTSRPSRAMNYISWEDLSAYLDWAKLRPMTELEYEKAARGPLSTVAGEYAWGTTTITQALLFDSSPELGTEAIAINEPQPNANYDKATFSLGDDFLGAAHAQGPVRAGIFAATSSGARGIAGAGYYGVMELSGNLDERVVSVGNTMVLYYWPSNGNGSLTSTGNASELGWIGLHTANGFTTGVDSAPDGSGNRGGSWNDLDTGAVTFPLRISGRSLAVTGDDGRASYFGGRGVRGYDTPDPLINCGNGTIEDPEQCDTPADPDCISCMCDADLGCP